MKLLGLIVVAVCLGTSSAGYFSRISSAVSDATNSVAKTATSAVNVQVKLAKTAVSTASNVAKTTTNMAKTAAESAVKSASTSAINTGISFFLAQARYIVAKTDNKNIGIPNISTSMGPISFNATGGFFRDISTMSQAGKANVSMNGTSILIDIAVKLDDIETGYDNFTVSMWKVKAGGGIKVHIANDSFVIHLRLKPGLTCALNVEKVDVTEFGGIDLAFNNMGPTSEWVLGKCSNMIVKFMKENIKKEVQSAIDSTLKKMLKENGSICSKFMG